MIFAVKQERFLEASHNKGCSDRNSQNVEPKFPLVEKTWESDPNCTQVPIFSGTWSQVPQEYPTLGTVSTHYKGPSKLNPLFVPVYFMYAQQSAGPVLVKNVSTQQDLSK